MRILELEKLFQSEETLRQILGKLENDFNIVDEYAEMLKSGIANNPEEAKKMLAELTGVYSNLTTVLAVAETEKKNREIRHYNKLKIDFDNEGKTDEKGKLIKFVSAIKEKEASGYVANYRRIRNLIAGYQEATAKSVSTLQSTLKYIATCKIGGQSE